MQYTITCPLTESLVVNFHFANDDDFIRSAESLHAAGCCNRMPVDGDDVRAIFDAVAAPFHEFPRAGDWCYTMGAPTFMPVAQVERAT